MHLSGMAARRRTVTILAAAALVTGGLALGAVHVSADQNRPESLTNAQRKVIKKATKQFRDIDAAIAAGYVPTDECFPEMGYHYVQFDLIDDVIDPTMPEVLVYSPTANGGRKLGAVEYLRVDADQDKSTDDDRPFLYGHGFDGPMDGHAPGQPIHYDKHVWLYKHNPDGELDATNPDVHCPGE